MHWFTLITMKYSKSRKYADVEKAGQSGLEWRLRWEEQKVGFLRKERETLRQVSEVRSA